MALIDPGRVGGRLMLSSLLFIVLALVRPVSSGEGGASAPGPRDKCPVCGMFVSKYPDWVASIRFRDGSVVFFDGPKCFFACYLNPGKCLPAKAGAAVASVRVMDYYDVQPIDARTAWYVIGSDVYGPMGRELIPFGSQVAAEEFRKDHQGRSVLRFSDVTRETVSALQ